MLDATPAQDDPGRVTEANPTRPDPEVPERAHRRTFTARYKLESWRPTRPHPGHCSPAPTPTPCRRDIDSGRMPLTGNYEPSPAQWVRDQVELYESSGGTEGTTLRGMPVVVITSRGAKSGILRKNPVMRVEHDGRYAAVVFDPHHRVLAQDAALGAAAGDDDHRHAAQRGPLGAAGALVELDLVADPLRGAGLVVPGKWHATRIYPSGRAWALVQG